MSARKLWNQHAYYVTNIEDDGSIGYAAPNYAPFSISDLNGFRQQRPGAFGALAASNLRVLAGDTCQERCGTPVEFWLQVGNDGEHITVDPGTTVVVYGVAGGARTELTRTTVAQAVRPGELTAGIPFAVADWAGFDHLVAVVDDPAASGSWGWGASKECDEEDNEVLISLEGLCE